MCFVFVFGLFVVVFVLSLSLSLLFSFWRGDGGHFAGHVTMVIGDGIHGFVVLYTTVENSSKLSIPSQGLCGLRPEVPRAVEVD